MIVTHKLNSLAFKTFKYDKGAKETYFNTTHIQIVC